MENNKQQQKSSWRLRKLEFEFKRGYSFDNTVDRYEGKIQFENDESENFTVKLRENMCQPYLELVAKEIVNSAEELYKRLSESLLKSNESKRA
jgi:hypothetical protein